MVAYCSIESSGWFSMGYIHIEQRRSNCAAGLVWHSHSLLLVGRASCARWAKRLRVVCLSLSLLDFLDKIISLLMCSLSKLPSVVYICIERVSNNLTVDAHISQFIYTRCIKETSIFITSTHLARPLPRLQEDRESPTILPGWFDLH